MTKQELMKKLNKSKLFPQEINAFLLMAIKNHSIDSEVEQELTKMLAEEEQLISAIDKKYA